MDREQQAVGQILSAIQYDGLVTPMAGGVSWIPRQWVWLVVEAFLTGMLNVVAGGVPYLLLPGALNDNLVSPESRSPTTHLPRGITRRSGITRMLPKTDGAPQRPARWVHQCLVQHRERVTCRIDQCLRPGSIVAKQAEWMLGIVRIRDHVLGNGSRRPRLRHII